MPDIKVGLGLTLLYFPRSTRRGSLFRPARARTSPAPAGIGYTRAPFICREVSMARALKTQEIREEFIRFFTERGHRHVASSPLVPIDDPTLLFTTAGMVQFKPMFAATGTADYSGTSRSACASPTSSTWATPRHLTFFEMLGNLLRRLLQERGH